MMTTEQGDAAMDETKNPYAAPRAPVQAPASGPQAEAELIRNEHLKHETSVKSIGLLYYLNAGALLLLGGSLLVVTLLAPAGSSEVDTLFATGFLAFYVALGAFIWFVGRGLRRLQPWVKIPVALISVLGLLGFPLGTLISLYILYLVFSEKGRTVLAPEYQEVMRLTPHIKYKTSILVWIALGFLLLLLLFAVVVIIADS